MRLLVLLAWLPSAALADRGPELGDLDRTADPCTDFYQFANGGWRAKNPIPADMPRWSRRWAAGEHNKEVLHQILDAAAAAKGAPKGSIEQLIGDFYGACMDEARADQLGAKPIEPMLAEIAAVRSRADLQRMIGRLHDIQIAAPFGVVSGADNHNPSQVIAQLFAAGLGLPDRDYYLKPDARFQEARTRYREHIARMFELAGRPPKQARAAAEVVFRMETGLARASLDNVTLRDPHATDHDSPFATLGKLAPHFDWAAYFDAAHLPRTDLNVQQPRFVQEVERQLVGVPLADWKTYLEWQLLAAAADSLSAPFVDESFSFNGAFLSGAKEKKPRWKRCAEAADAQLGEALGRKYVEKTFPPEAKRRVHELVQDLLVAMRQTLEGATWMGPDTKRRALEKLATFNPKIGYPDRWKDYSAIAIGRDSYWEDQLHARQWNVADDRALIGKPVDRGRWGLTPPTSDAYYNPLLNEIVFPAGILQPPAFDPQANDAVNYGAIGVVIGHEISHGFDDSGAQFDALGRLDNWWTADDVKRFHERGQCVVDQFDHYFIEPGMHHNGRLVLGESIADLAGAKMAYLALQIAQRRKPVPTVDGLTPDQQFFIAWGQFRGDATRPETQRLMVQGDPHPVAKFRVVGPVSNLPAFDKAFGCKPGAPMVRPAAERCEVW